MTKLNALEYIELYFKMETPSTVSEGRIMGHDLRFGNTPAPVSSVVVPFENQWFAFCAPHPTGPNPIFGTDLIWASAGNHRLRKIGSDDFP